MMIIPLKELSKFQAADREQCGILIEGPKGIHIAEVSNVHECPESYAIRMSDMEAVKKDLSRGESIFGFFHTHLPQHNSGPSDTDFDSADLNPSMQHCVYQPATKTLTWYGSHLTEVDI